MDIERSVYINGEIPFVGADTVTFNRYVAMIIREAYSTDTWKDMEDDCISVQLTKKTLK